MTFSQNISRRTVLRGLGTAMALPWLEAMGPLTSWATAAEGAPVAPNRMAFLYVPNGINMADWTPKEEGANYEMPTILKHLEKHRSEMLVLTGLTADKARANGDGGGDHARALSAFLTGCQPKKTDGNEIRAGVSVDQVAASRIGDQTRLPSLELGCEAGAMAGNCDSGYSCVYSSTMAWKSATQPLPKEVDPKLVFERMFNSSGDENRAKRDAVRKSVLDFVRDDASQLERSLGSYDRRKLDEYFTSVREIEQRIDRAKNMPAIEVPEGVAAPKGVPGDYAEHLRLMSDLLVLAFQTDMTRVSTFVLANEGSNKAYPFIGVSEGHHELSHHGNEESKKAKIRQINEFHVQQLAYLIDRLKSVPEAGGTLLDHCMIAYGSGNSDGNAHNHDDLPVLLFGKGGGTIQTGRHLKYAKETPLNNLWLSMLERMDVRLPNLGDSTGHLPGLNG